MYKPEASGLSAVEANRINLLFYCVCEEGHEHFAQNIKKLTEQTVAYFGQKNERLTEKIYECLLNGICLLSSKAAIYATITALCAQALVGFGELTIERALERLQLALDEGN